MTAPKVKMLAHSGGLPSGNYPATDLVRYIRADAPELVAVLRAFGDAIEMAHGLSFSKDKTVSEWAARIEVKANAALAAWEALK